MKNILILILTLLAFIQGCTRKLSSIQIPSIQSPSIKSPLIESPSIKSPSKSEKSVGKLEIKNLSGIFGEVVINKKAKRVYELTNHHSETIENIKASFDNNHFKFDLPYPGISTASTKTATYQPCSNKLPQGKTCLIAVTFQPISSNRESGSLNINYTIENKNYEFKYELSGIGKVQTEAQKLLEKLKSTFTENRALPYDANYNNKLIEGKLSKIHSKNFNYTDFFNDPSKKGYEVWEKQLKVNRVVGITFRSDSRPIYKEFKSCGDNWTKGFDLKNSITNRVIHYPAQIDEFGNGINCGIKDVGGFWPTFTRVNDMKKINNLLIEYKRTHQKDFDPALHPINDLFPNQAPIYSSKTDYLNWYVQNILNVSAHVHDDYDFKGFISTTTNPSLAKFWGTKNWVYATYVEGGFLLPEPQNPDFDLTHGGTFTKYSENEVAVPGGIDWEDVIGYIDRTTNKIYIRDGFKDLDKESYIKVLQGLSNAL